MDPIIRTEKLKYSYDSEEAGVLRLALDGVDLEIERGSFTAACLSRAARSQVRRVSSPESNVLSDLAIEVIISDTFFWRL